MMIFLTQNIILNIIFTNSLVFKIMKRKKEKIFMWFSEGAYETDLCKGPFFSGDIEKIGQKNYHTLSEILKIIPEDSAEVAKQLKRARPGSVIYFNSISSMTSLNLKCINDIQLKGLKKAQKIYSEYLVKKAEAEKTKKKYKEVIETVIKLKNED